MKLEKKIRANDAPIAAGMGPGFAISRELARWIERRWSLATAAAQLRSPFPEPPAPPIAPRIRVTARSPTEVPHWQVAVEVLMKRWVIRDGERALVSECDARGVPGAMASSCLICETDSAIRRIWRYPAEWHQLEDAQVFALFDHPLAAIRGAAPAPPASTPRTRRSEGSQGAAPMEGAAWR